MTVKESIFVVRRGISFLTDHPPDRIEFLAPYQIDCDNKVVEDRLVPIMTESRASLDEQPPVYLWLQVVDGPVDQAARCEKEAAGK